jgi:hypothetical protein
MADGSHMTRLLVTLLALGLLASGCVGADAQRARDLLEDSQRAMSGLRSLSYEADMSVTGAGPAMAVRMRGASRLRGGRTVDQHVRISADAGERRRFTAEAVVRGNRAWMKTDGRWSPLGSASAPASFGGLGPELLEQLAPYIESVSVDEDAVVGGQPAVVISCRIDTAGLVGEVAKLAGASEFPGVDDMIEQAGDMLHDLEATLVLDQQTHLLEAARLTLGVHAEGRSIEIAVSLRVTGVNRPVAIPAPTV